MRIFYFIFLIFLLISCTPIKKTQKISYSENFNREKSSLPENELKEEFETTKIKELILNYPERLVVNTKVLKKAIKYDFLTLTKIKPKMTFSEATKKVIDYINENNIDVSTHYLQEISYSTFERDDGKIEDSWLFYWPPIKKGSHEIIYFIIKKETEFEVRLWNKRIIKDLLLYKSEKTLNIPHIDINPVIDFHEACKLVKDYIRKNKIEIEDNYLASISLVLSSKNSNKIFWSFRWEPRGDFVLGGKLFIYVNMDKTVNSFGTM